MDGRLVPLPPDADGHQPQPDGGEREREKKAVLEQLEGEMAEIGGHANGAQHGEHAPADDAPNSTSAALNRA